MLNKLEKIEKQDTNYKEKIMKQNKEDYQKAKTVKAQKKIFEAIVGQRMVIQNNLTKANQFPQSELYAQFEESKKNEVEQLKLSLKENITSLNDICVMLGKRINVNMKTFQSDDTNMLEQIDKNYEKMIPSCEELIQKWHSRTQVNTSILNEKLSKKNVALSALQQPILTQVYKTLENKQFIETRTHLKRDVYRVLGKPIETLEEKLDFQIYDDKDFYQSIIKEFLNNSLDSIDPVNLDDQNVSISLTQEYLRKREKLKKSLDVKKKKSNKISKDKKLKYIIHDKLISFMAPQDTEALSAGREDILKILFGCSVQEQKDAQENENTSKAVQDANSYKRAKIEEEDLEIDLI